MLIMQHLIRCWVKFEKTMLLNEAPPGTGSIKKIGSALIRLIIDIEYFEFLG
jgi:hypothetical protein